MHTYYFQVCSETPAYGLRLHVFGYSSFHSFSIAVKAVLQVAIFKKKSKSTDLVFENVQRFGDFARVTAKVKVDGRPAGYVYKRATPGSYAVFWGAAFKTLDISTFRNFLHSCKKKLSKTNGPLLLVYGPERGLQIILQEFVIGTPIT